MSPPPEPPFSLTQLRYFVTAATTGSMTDAARALVVSQSAVSTAVAGLERRLGVQLFVRHHARGLSLTRAGEQFRRRAVAFLAEAVELGDVATGLGASLTGHLSVGCFASLAPFYLPRLLEAFAAVAPGVSVEIVEGETRSLCVALADGRCELALLYDLGLGEGIATEALGAVAPYLAVAADHRLARAGRVHLSEVADEAMVLLDLPHSREYFETVAARSGRPPRVAYRSSSYETVRCLVAQGFGYTILNQRPVSDVTYDGGRIACLGLLDDLDPLPVVLAAASAVRPTPRAAAFAAVCRTLVPELHGSGPDGRTPTPHR